MRYLQKNSIFVIEKGNYYDYARKILRSPVALRVASEAPIGGGEGMVNAVECRGPRPF